MSLVYRKICTGVSFSKGKPVLDIFCRNSDNERSVVKVFDLPCYFYVKEDEVFEEDIMKQSVISEHQGYMSLFGQKLKKIKVRRIREIRQLGKTYHGFESDMKWDKKCLLDLKITDRFVYEKGKVYTLDKRFSALNKIENKIITNDGLSASTILETGVDKAFIEQAMDEEKMLLKSRPKFGHAPFEVRHAILDIEVIVDNREDLKTYDGKIACVVIWDSYTDKYFKFKLESSERDLLIDVLEKLQELDVDIISGWNIDFDLKWIINRSMNFDLDLSVYFPGGKTFITKYTDASGKFHEDIYLGGRIMLDGMELYKKKTMTTEKLSSYSLKAVAVVEGFPDWEDLGSKIKKLWDTESDKIVEYCKIDVERTKQIIEKKRLLSNALTICKFYGCGFNEVTVNSRVIESLMFLLKGNRILPNTVRGKEKAKVVGAIVLETTAGLHKNVGIFDAASLYPSIISGLNVSPECLELRDDVFKENVSDCLTVPIDDHVHYLYKKEHKIGLMTEVILEMRKLREQIRKQRSDATKDGNKELYALYTDDEKVAKGVLASVYGVMGFSEFRLFNEDCANIITGIARNVIKLITEKVDSEKHHVIAGDTDSVFIKTESLEEGFNAADKINVVANEYMRSLGVDEGTISVNFEKFFTWILFSKRVAPKRKTKLWKKDTGSAKKRYIGFLSHIESGPREMKSVDELYYRGFELRRSDSALVLKDVMREFFELMGDGSYHRSVDYLKDVYKAFKNYDKDYISMPRSVNVEDANNPWANGMRYSKDNLGFEFNEDEMPRLLYVKDQRKYPKTDVLCYQAGHQIPVEFKVDYDTMFNKLIRKKFEPILESLGLFWDTHIGSQSNLDAWT